MIGYERRGWTRLTFSLVLLTMSAVPAWAQEPDTAQARPDTTQVQAPPPAILGVPVAAPRAPQPAAPAVQQRDALRVQQPDTLQSRTHVVRRGDTLWDIARTYLANPFEWPRVYDLNTGIVSDPHWIYPNQELVLPGSLLRRDLPPTVLGTPLTWEPARERPDVVAPEPEPTVIADLDLREPVMRPGEYLATPWLADTTRMAWAGRVVRIADPAAHEDRMPSMLRQFQQVHLGNMRVGVAAGDSLQIVRVGRTVAGGRRIVEPLGLLEVDSVAADVVVATVARLYGEAREGDRVVTPELIPEFARGTPTPVASGAEGRLVAMLEEQPLYGTTDVGFVNLGASAVAVGDELEVYLPNRNVAAGNPAPPQRVGIVRVVRVAGPTATVRILQVENTAFDVGQLVRVIRTVQ